MAMMSVALRAAGLHLRSADPAAMKAFLLAVHARAATAAAQGAMSTRAEVSPISLKHHLHRNVARLGYQQIPQV